MKTRVTDVIVSTADRVPAGTDKATLTYECVEGRGTDRAVWSVAACGVRSRASLREGVLAGFVFRETNKGGRLANISRRPPPSPSLSLSLSLPLPPPSRVFLDPARGPDDRTHPPTHPRLHVCGRVSLVGVFRPPLNGFGDGHSDGSRRALTTEEDFGRGDVGAAQCHPEPA